jgi:hypothetical protein
LLILSPLTINANTVTVAKEDTILLEKELQAQATSLEQNRKTIPSFSATYTLLHKSTPIGQALRKLTYLDSGDAVYYYETEIEWLIFSDSRSETSTLTINNDKVTPQHYVYKREGTGRDKNYEWRYQLHDKTAIDIKKIEKSP